ncbi:hypothetical protein ACFOLJ_15030 [Rugamonas sp. CCM 8940]|nr:hypothetical protein [Rugamonas sp. CCM 8940]MBJ7313538.1 hypothetical protein [Rugamonas sp. CCM 8940]
MVASAATVKLMKRYASLPVFAASKDYFAATIPKREAALAKGETMAMVEGLPPAQVAALAAPREPFTPQIANRGNMADDAALMAWVEQTLNAPPAAQ